MDDERYARLIPHMDELKELTFLVSRDPKLHYEAEHWDSAFLRTHSELPDIEVTPADYATILYTSGTTGRPKGALHTHRNHITNFKNALLGGAITAAINGIEPDPEAPQTASLQTFPFFHIGGVGSVYVGPYVGSRLVLMYRWDAADAIRLIQQEKITSWAGVPTVVRQLLEHPDATPEALMSLGSIASGGAPVPEDLINTVGEKFESRVSPGNGYGSTESTGAIITNGGTEYLARPNSVGLPVPTMNARVVDDQGNTVADGEIGEIWLKGPSMFAGYWNKPEATADSFSNGWFKTGDLGYRSEEGYFYVVDRKKDVIIRGGENVYCAEVEACLFKHPDVADVALIGLPHRELGEEVCAVIEPQPGTNPSIDELQAFVQERLARFNVPTRIFFVDEPLPRNATGKVLKRDLKERFA